MGIVTPVAANVPRARRARRGIHELDAPASIDSTRGAPPSILPSPRPRPLHRPRPSARRCVRRRKTSSTRRAISAEAANDASARMSGNPGSRSSCDDGSLRRLLEQRRGAATISTAQARIPIGESLGRSVSSGKRQSLAARTRAHSHAESRTQLPGDSVDHLDLPRDGRWSACLLRARPSPTGSRTTRPRATLRTAPRAASRRRAGAGRRTSRPRLGRSVPPPENKSSGSRADSRRPRPRRGPRRGTRSSRCRWCRRSYAHPRE